MNIKEKARKYGVCDLEYAKKLKELKVRQESLYYWQVYKKSGDVYLIPAEEALGFLGALEYISEVCNYYSAFTVAELGTKLPISVYYNNCWYFYRGYKSGQDLNNECVDIQYRSNSEHTLHRTSGLEANARAKMRIYLIEKGLIKL